MALPPTDIQILSVDDFSTMRRIVKNLLRQLGYTWIDEAVNGADALDAMRGKRYDLVISDWNMPQKSGIELLEEIRADPSLRNTPFLMVTAESDRDQVADAVDAGVSNYLLKPFTANGLRDTLRSMF